MSLKAYIIQRADSFKGRCLRSSMPPAVVIGTGVDPKNKGSFKKVIVLSALDSKKLLLECLNDAIKTVEETMHD